MNALKRYNRGLAYAAKVAFLASIHAEPEFAAKLSALQKRNEEPDAPHGYTYVTHPKTGVVYCKETLAPDAFNVQSGPNDCDAEAEQTCPVWHNAQSVSARIDQAHDCQFQAMKDNLALRP